jgi:hypothetical protein
VHIAERKEDGFGVEEMKISVWDIDLERHEVHPIIDIKELAMWVWSLETRGLDVIKARVAFDHQ